jgi:hypothetical protein
LLLQTDARFEKQLANSQEAFEQPVLNSAAGYEQQKASSGTGNREGVQLLNRRAGESEQRVVAANSWEAGSEQQVAANSLGSESEQQVVATNSWARESEQQVAANSWEAGSEQRLGTNSWGRESEQRAEQNSQPEVSEQRSGNIPAPNRRPGYELVETVEATQDLAEQLSSLCARFCGYRRSWLPGRPRSAARRRPANQRMVIRKESQKYQIKQGQQLILGTNNKILQDTYQFPENTCTLFAWYQDKMSLDIYVQVDLYTDGGRYIF